MTQPARAKWGFSLVKSPVQGIFTGNTYRETAYEKSHAKKTAQPGNQQMPGRDALKIMIARPALACNLLANFLLDFYGRHALELLADGLGFFLVDALFYRLGRAIDQVLGFLQT